MNGEQRGPKLALGIRFNGTDPLGGVNIQHTVWTVWTELSSFLLLGMFPIAFVDSMGRVRWDYVSIRFVMHAIPESADEVRSPHSCHARGLSTSHVTYFTDSECNIHSLLMELFARPATQNEHMRQVLMTESAYNHNHG